MEQQLTDTRKPSASTWVTSPLRNRIKLQLDAPIAEVWHLVGHPSRMPEFSSGLQKVETRQNSAGKDTGYTCYFAPETPNGSVIEHHAALVWQEPRAGWASVDEEPNLFGLRQSLTLVTLEKSGSKTLLTWDMHYTCDDTETLLQNLKSLELALNQDIAQNLLKRFGGSMQESYVDPSIKK
ncbi:MAG: SRPBCC family protein [Pontibacter sp.]|nr:SRPBCC family protein [Pontibacter sp.]